MDDSVTVHFGRGNREKPRFEKLMELSELIEQVKATDPVAFADALQKEAHGHYQVAFKRGFGTAKAEAEEKITAINAELETVKGGVSAKDAEIKELRAKQPDLEKWTKDKEAALLAKEQEWKDKYEALQTELTRGKSDAERLRIINALKDEAHVIPYVAESALGRDEIASRMKLQPDGTFKYYSRDGQTPLQPVEGEDPARFFAKTLVAEKVIPEEFVKPPRNTGGPGSNYSGGGVPGQPKRSTMSDADKIAFINEHGTEKYLNLPS